MRRRLFVPGKIHTCILFIALRMLRTLRTLRCVRMGGNCALRDDGWPLTDPAIENPDFMNFAEFKKKCSLNFILKFSTLIVLHSHRNTEQWEFRLTLVLLFGVRIINSPLFPFNSCFYTELCKIWKSAGEKNVILSIPWQCGTEKITEFYWILKIF